MKKVYFLILGCLFSVCFSKAQQANGYVDFCGHAYYEVKNGATVLHWKDTCGNVLYYQIHEKRSWSGWAMLDSISGKDTSYLLPDYLDSTYRGEVYYLLAFYKNGTTAKSKSFYIPETQMYLDTVTQTVRTANNNSSRTNQGTSPTRGTGNFSYQLNSDGGVVLSWNIDEAMQAESFRIERNEEILANLPPDYRMYTDTNPGLGTHVYTLGIHYVGGMTEEVNLLVDIFPDAVVTFGYNWDNNNLVLNWNVAAEGVPPQSFEIKCGNEHEHIADIPATDEIFAYNCTIPNPTVGAFTYYLYTHYSADEVSVTSIEIEINIAKVESFTATAMDVDNALLQWTIPQEGVLPLYFQIKRNGNIIAGNVAATERTYLDTNLEEGTYEYQVISYYENTASPHISEEDIVTIEYLDYALPINFKYAIVNKDVLMFWNIMEGEEMPVSFQVRRDDNVIWETQDSLTYGYIDTNLAVGTYTYRLYALYENGMIATFNNTFNVMIIETSDEIEIGEGMVFISRLLEDGSYFPDSIRFTYAVMDNNVNLSWTIAEEAIQPTAFQLERNGEFLVNLSGDQRTYQDLNLEVGTYVYAIKILYNADWVHFIRTLICTIRDCY